MRICEIRVMTGSFPTQFCGRTFDGWYFFAHYRNGVFSVGLSTVSVDEAIRDSSRYEEDDGTGDGIMEIEEFLRRLRVSDQARLAPLTANVPFRESVRA